VTIEEIIDKTKRWSELPMPADAPAGAASYEGNLTLVNLIGGKKTSWRFVVVEFSIEDQGFPAGSKGYDGTVTSSEGVVMRLTRAQAERAFKRAKAA
jgi:hypothetical protein